MDKATSSAEDYKWDYNKIQNINNKRASENVTSDAFFNNTRIKYSEWLTCEAHITMPIQQRLKRGENERQLWRSQG